MGGNNDDHGPTRRGELKIENIFYEDKQEFIHGYYVRLGYLPTTQEYAAVRTNDPLFFMSGKTREEALQKATDALKFYLDHGLKE